MIMDPKVLGQGESIVICYCLPSDDDVVLRTGPTVYFQGFRSYFPSFIVYLFGFL